VRRRGRARCLFPDMYGGRRSILSREVAGPKMSAMVIEGFQSSSIGRQAGLETQTCTVRYELRGTFKEQRSQGWAFALCLVYMLRLEFLQLLSSLIFGGANRRLGDTRRLRMVEHRCRGVC